MVSTEDNDFELLQVDDERYQPYNKQSKSTSKQSMLSLDNLPAESRPKSPASGRLEDGSEINLSSVYNLSNKKSQANSSLHKRTMKESARVQEDLLRVQSILEETYLKNLGQLGDNLSGINTSAGGEPTTTLLESTLEKKMGKKLKPSSLQRTSVDAGKANKAMSLVKYARKIPLNK